MVVATVSILRIMCNPCYTILLNIGQNLLYKRVETDVSPMQLYNLNKLLLQSANLDLLCLTLAQVSFAVLSNLRLH